MTTPQPDDHRTYGSSKRPNEAQDYDHFLREGYWPATPDLWDALIDRTRVYLEENDIDEQEVDYKLQIGGRLAAVRGAVLLGSLTSDDLPGQLKSAFQRQNNLTNQFSSMRFAQWINERQDDVLNTMRAAWSHSDQSIIVKAFRELERSRLSEYLNSRSNWLDVIPVLLMGVSAEDYPPYRLTQFRWAYEQTGYPKPGENAPAVEVYEHALGFLDRFIAEAKQREVPLRHRLEAQSVVWALHYDRDVSDEGKNAAALPGEDKSSALPVDEPLDLLALADNLSLPVSFLDTIAALLKEKPQVIFQGPPGTGKTYVARELANLLAGSPERVTLVQFHPSYAYEDFIQGFRPIPRSRRADSFCVERRPAAAGSGAGEAGAER